MKVEYSRAVLISTGQYENQRIVVGITDDVDDHKETYKEALARVRNIVDNALFEQVYSLKFGEVRKESERIKQQKKAIAVKYGFNYTEQ